MNAGFIALGLVLNDLSAMYYFLVTYAIGSAGALAAISSFSGKGDLHETLDGIRGRGRKKPLEGIAAVICLASLAGLPPLSGFLAKFVLFTGVVKMGYVALAAGGFVLSIVAMFYYLRIAIALFAPVPAEDQAHGCCCNCLSSAQRFLLRFGIVMASLALIALSVMPLLFPVAGL